MIGLIRAIQGTTSVCFCAIASSTPLASLRASWHCYALSATALAFLSSDCLPKENALLSQNFMPLQPTGELLRAVTCSAGVLPDNHPAVLGLADKVKYKDGDVKEFSAH